MQLFFYFLSFKLEYEYWIVNYTEFHFFRLEDAIDLIELYQIIHPGVNMLESINMVTMEIDNVEQSEEAMKQLKKNKLMNGYCIKRETDENTISEKLKILMVKFYL